MSGELENDMAKTRWKAWLSASWRRWTVRILGALLTLVLLLGVIIDTSFGHRLVANYISGMQPASGLRIKVGEITGSLYGKAEFHDLALSDPQGEFLQVPLTELDWRPLRWFTYGLDIRQLSFRQGTLSRFPEFAPGDPDSALLPGFNIRVDQFEIDQLEIAEGLAGERRQVSMLARARVDDGMVRLGVDGDLGGTDRLLVQLEAQPDADRFALDLEYNAPAGGLLAGLTGADEDWHAGISGEGGWSAWDGQLAVQRAGEELAAFGLSNRSGQYQAQGQFRPYGELDPVVERAAGDVVALDVGGTFINSTFDGEVTLASTALQMQGNGSINFADNRFDNFAIALTLLDPRLLDEDVLLEGARATATINGRFSSLRIDHELHISRLGLQFATLEQVSQQGLARREDDGWNIDLDADILRLRTGLEDADRVLARSQVDGILHLRGSILQSDRLSLVSPVIAAQVALDADLSRSDYALAGRAEVSRLDMRDLARIDASGTFEFAMGEGSPWSVTAEISGKASNIAIDLVRQVAGSELGFAGMLSAGEGRPIVLADSSLSGELLELAFDAEVDGDQLAISGTGEHGSYGPLRFAASRQGEESQAEITLDSPFAPAGLENVNIALASMDGGFSVETKGHSRFGPFDGQLSLLLPEEQPPRIAVDRFDVWRTSLSGQMVIADGLVLGELDLAGGGVEGSVEFLRSSDDVQGYKVDLTASNARFGGATELTVGEAHLVAEGDFANDNSKLRGTFDAQGVAYGEFFIGRLAGQADLVGGEGRAAFLLVGRSGSDFELQFETRIRRDRAIVEARGSYNGEPISMPRPAMINWADEGAWRVAPFQLNFDGGLFLAEAQADPDGSVRGRVRLDDMPIAEIGMIRPDTGLTGMASGSLAWSIPADGAPRAAMDIELVDFSRSGLTMSSRPVDIVANASLSEDQLRISARASEDEDEVGHLNLTIADLPAAGSLLERLYDGQLGGNVQYDGPASSIWRLAQLDTFDVTGPLAVRASFSGTPSAPRISGSLQGDGMRLNSGTTGTDISNISLSGRFTGSNLELTRFSGTTSGNGTVSASGTVGFADLLENGPTIDIRIAARQAQLLGRSDITATLTGPMRIVSDGSGGTIAGRVRVDSGRWRLGQAESAEAIPVIETVEINLPSSRAPANPRRGSWAYMIDAQATNQLEVEGLGLDSEWSADVRLRGTVEDPRIGGRAELVRGDFVFGGSTFELERGDIRFDETIEPDPVLDILANSQIDELDVYITVTGRATAPQIDLRSTPRLPEDELLSRILFGGPLNELSPLSALQMGSALASLRSGGGLRPINGLRQAAGLDHLRLLAPDPSIDRGTALAAGRYFTRRIYVELVTDGQGYTATQLEFRLTSWLQLLASTSSLNRERVTLEYRKDY